ACWIEHADVARIHLRSRLRLLVSGPHEILPALSQTRLAAARLEPESTECVVCEELHDVAWGEELIPHGQLTAIARRLTLLAHLLPLVAAVEILEDPADGFVLDPDA